MLREGQWCLSLLTVDPDAQSRGAGRALFDATLAYGEADRRGALIVASDDARALTMYARAGFDIRPTVAVEGALPDRLPAAEEAVRPVALESLAALEPISRAVRGAAQTSELEWVAGDRGARVLALEDRGFVVITDDHGVWSLAARDEPAAEALLQAAIGELRAPGEIARWLTAEQGWAVRMLVGLGLRLQISGALCVSGEAGPLAPYIPSPPFA